MKFDSAAVPSEVPKFFSRVVDITGWGPWNKRLETFAEQSKINPFIKQFFMDRYALEWEMGRLYIDIMEGRKATLPKTKNKYRLFVFLANVARVHARLSIEGQKRLSGMIRSGLNSEYGLSSLEHEMTTASYLMKKDFDVHFNDIENGSGADLIIQKNGLLVEVECKTISADVGKNIHQKNFYQLGGYIAPFIKGIVEESAGIHVFHITLSGRLNSDNQHFAKIQSALALALKSKTGESATSECVASYHKVSCDHFILKGIFSKNLSREDLKGFLERAFGLSSQHMLALISGKQRAALLVVESDQKDNVPEYIFKQIRRARSKQLKEETTAMIFVKFNDLSEDDLFSIYKYDEAGNLSELRRMCGALFSRSSWSHVHTIGFFPPEEMISEEEVGLLGTTSIARGVSSPYTFSNPNNGDYKKLNSLLST